MLKHWLHQFGAFLIAWTILLAANGIVDELCNTKSQFFAAAWICIGIGVMLARKIDFPMPNPSRVDVPGAFRMLWWAVFWPRYLVKN